MVRAPSVRQNRSSSGFVDHLRDCKMTQDEDASFNLEVLSIALRTRPFFEAVCFLTCETLAQSDWKAVNLRDGIAE